MDLSQERRHFHRVQFAASAVLSQRNHRQIVEVLDLSLKGVLLDGVNIEEFDLDQAVQLSLVLTDSVEIHMDLRCTHREPSSFANNLKCGFRCDGFDVESVSHLRRLVELNLGDSSVLDRELSELIGARP